MKLDKKDRQRLSSCAVQLGKSERSASFLVCDHQQIHLAQYSTGFTLLPIALALETIPSVRERYYFKAVSSDYDERVSLCAQEENPLGFYLHIEKNQKVQLPCQVAMYMKSDGLNQHVHNVVILEEGAELHLITSCLASKEVYTGTHIAIEEQYVHKGAHLMTTMVHSWSAAQYVYPYAATIVEEDGSLESNYIALECAKQIVSNPKAYLIGKRACAKFQTVIFAQSNAFVDTGGDVYLQGEDSSAELAHRGVSTGSIMHQGGLLVGEARCKAHIDCAGMILTEEKEGYIKSVPGLISKHPDARMSHEASIGKIAPDQVAYLMSKGMEEREAISLLVRGFLGVDSFNLGREMDEKISQIIELSGHGEA